MEAAEASHSIWPQILQHSDFFEIFVNQHILHRSVDRLVDLTEERLHGLPFFIKKVGVSNGLAIPIHVFHHDKIQRELPVGDSVSPIYNQQLRKPVNFMP